MIIILLLIDLSVQLVLVSSHLYDLCDHAHHAGVADQALLGQRAVEHEGQVVAVPGRGQVLVIW